MLTGIFALQLIKTIPLYFQDMAIFYKLDSPWKPSKVNIVVHVRPSLLGPSSEKQGFYIAMGLSSLGVSVVWVGGAFSISEAADIYD